MAPLETPDINVNDVTNFGKDMATMNEVTPLLTSFEDILASPSTFQQTLPFIDFVTPCADELPVNMNACEMMEAILRDLGIDVTPPAMVSPNLRNPPKEHFLSNLDCAAIDIAVETTQPNRLCGPIIGEKTGASASSQRCPRNRWRSSGDGIRSTQQRIPGRRKIKRDCVITKAQHVILKGAYSRTRWPSQFDIQEIAAITSLPQHRVTTWFEEERKMTGMRKRLFSDDVTSSSSGPRPKRRATLFRTT